MSIYSFYSHSGVVLHLLLLSDMYSQHGDVLHFLCHTSYVTCCESGMFASLEMGLVTCPKPWVGIGAQSGGSRFVEIVTWFIWRTKHWVDTACILSWVMSPVQNGDRDEHESSYCYIIVYGCEWMIVIWVRCKYLMLVCFLICEYFWRNVNSSWTFMHCYLF